MLPLSFINLFCLGALLAVKIHLVGFWVDNLQRCSVESWIFNTLYFSGLAEIGVDPGLLNVPKSHL